MTNAARDFEQLTLIRDDERHARDVSREHYAMMREQVATNRSFDSMDDREALATLLSIARTTRTAGDPLTVADDLLAKAVEQVFDFRPAAIIRDLDLRRPIYRQLAAYGHMGREDLGVRWEGTDRADALRQAVESLRA